MLASEEHRKSIGACEAAELGNAALEAAQGGTCLNTMQSQDFGE